MIHIIKQILHNNYLKSKGLKDFNQQKQGQVKIYKVLECRIFKKGQKVVK